MVKQLPSGWDLVALTALYNGEPGARHHWEKLVNMNPPLVERWQGDKPEGRKGHPPVVYAVTRAGAARIKMPYEDRKSFSTLQFKDINAHAKVELIGSGEEIRNHDQVPEPEAPPPAISDAEFSAAFRAYFTKVVPNWTDQFRAKARFRQLSVTEIPDFVKKKFGNDINMMRKYMAGIEEGITFDQMKGLDPFRDVG